MVVTTPEDGPAASTSPARRPFDAGRHDRERRPPRPALSLDPAAAPFRLHRTRRRGAEDADMDEQRSSHCIRRRNLALLAGSAGLVAALPRLAVGAPKRGGALNVATAG